MDLCAGDSGLASALAEELKFEHDNAAESNAASTEVLAELKSKGWEVSSISLLPRSYAEDGDERAVLRSAARRRSASPDTLKS